MIMINKPPMLEGSSAEDDINTLRTYLHAMVTDLEQKLNMELEQTHTKIDNIFKEE